MSVLTAIDVGPAAVETGGRGRGRGREPGPGRRRRWRWPGAVAAAVLLAAVVTALAMPTTATGDLDPRSTATTGSRAVAQVLRSHGVRVDLVRHAQDAVRGAGPSDTIVIVHPELLGPDQLEQFLDTPADLVLVAPDLIVLAELAPDIRPAGVAAARTAPAGCADPDAVAAGPATAGGHLYRFGDTSTDTSTDTSGGAGGGPTGPLTGCYPVDGGVSVVRQAQASHRVTVLGQAEVLQNGTLATEGNAALALRTLGARPDVRWYLPDPLDRVAAAGPSPADLLPTWVRWVFWQLVIAVGVTLGWRARRLGPVVTEPLPVVVRSAETVEGRARLYRSSHSRGHAAAILRTVALRRLAARLGVPVAAPPQEVAALAAAATGRDPALVREQLLGPAPSNDAGLVALAASLDAIERSVADASGGYGDPRSRPRPPGARPGATGAPPGQEGRP